MPRITISYRRDDSGAITGRIFDRLAAHYGRESIFRDIDNIPPGVDFRKHIDGILDESDVVIAVVGPRWVGPRGGQSRLSNAADPVRVEIETALRKNCPLIPVLVLRGTMPRVEHLPESLQDFAYHNAVSVDSGQDFDVHMARLIRAMDRILEEVSPGSVPAAASAAALEALPPTDGEAVPARSDARPVAGQAETSAEIAALRAANQALEAKLAALTGAPRETAAAPVPRGKAMAALTFLRWLALGLIGRLLGTQRGRAGDDRELLRAEWKIQQLNARIAEMTQELRLARAGNLNAARRHPATVALATAGALVAAAVAIIVVNITEWHRLTLWLERAVLDAKAWWR